MKQSRYSISSFDCIIHLDVEASEAFHKKLTQDLFWHEFIPAFQFRTCSQADQTWSILETSTFSYSIQDRTIHAQQTTIKKMIVIIEAVFEQLRQRMSLYTLHGCVIVRKSQAVALIGSISGIGKTTLAAYATQHKWLWVGDEKFTLSGGHFIGSTHGILNDTKTRSAAAGKRPNSSRTKYGLALICQPIITSENQLTWFKLSKQRAQWTLYNEVTRDIRQVDGIITSETPPLPSFDTPNISLQRLKAVNALVDTTSVLYLRGPKHLILEKLDNLLSVTESAPAHRARPR